MELEEAVVLSAFTPRGDPGEKRVVWGIPLILWGASGIGKSDRMDQLAEDLGMPIVSLYPGGHPPEDFVGVPVRQNDGTLERICPLDEINQIVYHKTGILFLDEMSCASRPVQAVLLKLFLKRQIANQKLPPGVRIMAAANPPSEAADGWQLSGPNANRFIHRDEPLPSAAAWAEYELSGPTKRVTNFKVSEERVRDEWNKHAAAVAGEMTTFVQRRDELLHKRPPDGHPDEGRAWPSPRTWSWSIKLVTTARCLGFGLDVQKEAVAYAVGGGPADEWLAWVVNSDLPSISSVLNGTWKSDPTRLDRSMAVYGMLRKHVLELPVAKRGEILPAVWKVYEEAVESGLADTVKPSVKALVDAKLGTSVAGDAAKKTLAALFKEGHTRFG